MPLICDGKLIFKQLNENNPNNKIPFQVLLFALLTVVTITHAFPQATERPAISDDQIESTLKDKRYLHRQLKCALGEAPCDPVGRRLKSKYLLRF